MHEHDLIYDFVNGVFSAETTSFKCGGSDPCMRMHNNTGGVKFLTSVYAAAVSVGFEMAHYFVSEGSSLSVRLVMEDVVTSTFAFNVYILIPNSSNPGKGTNVNI